MPSTRLRPCRGRVLSLVVSGLSRLIVNAGADRALWIECTRLLQGLTIGVRAACEAVVGDVSSDNRIGVIVLRLRIEHEYSRMRRQRRALRNIERRVLARYQATLLPSGEHQLHISYRTETDLDDLMDDLLFEIAGEAQLSGCYSETEARLEGTDRQW